MTSRKRTGSEVCYSDDEEMKRLLIRKRQREESELYNAPETMAVKRRAVKEAAKTMPVPKKIPNLNFDDQIEPSEGPEEEVEMNVEQAEVHAEEKGSNAAQSGVGGVAEDGEAKVEESKKNWEHVPVRARKGKPKARTTTRRKTTVTVPIAVRTRSKTIPVVRKVTIDPIRWAKKSNQGARRSRRRLRRLLTEQEALISEQLQTA